MTTILNRQERIANTFQIALVTGLNFNLHRDFSESQCGNEVCCLKQVFKLSAFKLELLSSI